VSLTVTKTFDPEGRVLFLTQKSAPDSNHIGAVKRGWTYDRLGRRLTETQYIGTSTQFHTDSWAYDAAGNAVTWITRIGSPIVTTYDALNRPTRRIVPSLAVPIQDYTDGSSILADTAVFGYDVAGNLDTANNIYAQIARTYNVNVSIATDTLHIRTSVLLDSNFTSHV